MGLWFLAFLLAMALACSTINSPTPSAGPIMTAAAATASALAITAPVTSAPIPTVAGPATAASTRAANHPATPAGTGASPTPPPGPVVQLDPCSLLSQAEAESLLGAKANSPTVQNGACVYSEAQKRVTVVNVYAYPAAQAGSVFEGHVLLLRGYQVTLDPAALARLKADSASGDMVAALNDLTGMAVGQSNYHAEKVDGLGRAALWSWNAVSSVQQAYLLAAKPRAVVGMELVLGPSSQEAATRQAVAAIIQRILTGLPDRFVVPGVPIGASAPLDR